jgi:hypothetical protein
LEHDVGESGSPVERAESQRSSTVLTTDTRRLVSWAVSLFLLARLADLVVFALVAGPDSLGHRLAAWDGGYYLHIAQFGYPNNLPAHAGDARLFAFFPMFPAVIRAVHWLLPGSYLLSAVLVSIAAGSIAATLVALIARYVLGLRSTPTAAYRGALITAAAWSVQPASFVLSMAYSEGLFSALAAGSLLALIRRRWLLAGLLACLAGLTRPTGFVLALCCLTAAGLAVRSAHRSSPGSAETSAFAPVRLAVCVVLAPLGAIGYIVWVGLRVHQARGWFTAQREGWKVYTDGGAYLARKIQQYALHPGGRPSGVAVIAVVFVAFLLLVALLRARPPAVLAIYAFALAAVTFTTHGAFGSVPRFLLPAFPMLLPLGARLGRLRTLTLAVAFALAAIATGLAGAWVTGQTVLPP